MSFPSDFIKTPYCIVVRLVISTVSCITYLSDIININTNQYY